MSLQTNTTSPAKTASRDESYWAAMREAAERSYADALAENEAAARGAAEQASEAARLAREATAAEYRGLDRQLYRDYMEQSRVLPQALSAGGYTGGLSESGRLRLKTSYEEALSENARRRIGEEAGIERTRAQAELSARQTAREADARARTQRDERLLDLRTRQYSQQRGDDLRRAQELAGAGDYSGYRALGFSEDEIAYLSRIWAARNPNLRGVWSYGHYA